MGYLWNFRYVRGGCERFLERTFVSTDTDQQFFVTARLNVGANRPDRGMLATAMKDKAALDSAIRRKPGADCHCQTLAGAQTSHHCAKATIGAIPFCPSLSASWFYC